MKKRTEITAFLLIVLVSAFLRFYQLGFSDFYGDETKTLYFRKDISAYNFLLNQRKGPVQFVVSWIVEKITGGYKESHIRFPFALSGFLSVIAVYVLTRRLFGVKPALISTALFSINGFMIAFSRTAQYQSFLILFGLISIIAILGKTRLRLLISSLALGLAFLSHYDAVFFGLVVAVILAQKILSDRKIVKSVLVFFVLPLVLLTATFYIPYIISGYFQKNTINYVSRRISGKEYKPNNSYYTYKVYNPGYGTLVLLIFGLLSIFFLKSLDRLILVIWFGIPFFLFEVVFSNPGTHILNYVIPLIIFSGVFLDEIAKRFHVYLIIFLMIIVYSVSQAMTFIPFLSSGYPWTVNKIDNKYNLFLYGFPYNRGWRHIREYFLKNGMPRSFYTNDNVTIGEWYLRGVSSKILTDSQFPEVYINVSDNQEFRNEEFTALTNYIVIKEIYGKEGGLTALIKKYRPVK